MIKCEPSELTQDGAYLCPLILFLQDTSKMWADGDVVDVVQQDQYHSSRQINQAAQTYEVTELWCKGNISKLSFVSHEAL